MCTPTPKVFTNLRGRGKGENWVHIFSLKVGLQGPCRAMRPYKVMACRRLQPRKRRPLGQPSPSRVGSPGWPRNSSRPSLLLAGGCSPRRPLLHPWASGSGRARGWGWALAPLSRGPLGGRGSPSHFPHNPPSMNIGGEVY
jgi:hypothetical protein